MAMETETIAAPATVRVAAPEPVELLRRILDRLDALSAKVERLEGLAGRMPDVAGVVVDSFDEEYRRAQAAGIDLDQRARALIGLAEKVSAPEVLRAVYALLARADRIEPLLALADQAPGLFAMVVDSADEAVRRAGARGLDLDAAVRRGAGAALRFGAMMGPTQLDSLQALLESGVLDPPAVRAIAALGRAVATEAVQPGDGPGLFGLVRAAREPDVRRALGFMLHVARAFGRELPLANADGWVDVDKHTLRHVRYTNVFALGDASSLPTSKTGAAIRKQAPVLVENLLAALEQRPDGAAYDGYTSCPVVTGYGSLILAEFDYSKNPTESFPFDQSQERYSMYALKAYALPRLYWHGMLRGRV